MFYLIFIFFFVFEVSSQICNRTTRVLRDVPETYKLSYYEAFEGNDCILCPCTKSRLSVSIGIRTVEKLVQETVNVCCEGYVEDIHHDNGLKCLPVCDPPCQNGFCSSPNECTCYPGYGHDPNEPLNQCVPLCLENCGISHCLPTCSLDYYDHAPDECNDCQNGKCVAPDICHCNPGYVLISGSCQPNCSCENGRCISPGICECYYGYKEECGTCMPLCSGCEHGRCKSPGNCVCDEGYRAVNGSCQPLCEGCVGKCLAPDQCACDPGWYLSKGRCLPHCDVPCGNGTCIEPNICNCHLGFEARGFDAPICKAICTNCSYTCIFSGVCECDPHFEAVYTTEDGSECDCFECDDPLRKCVNATCELRTEDNVGKELENTVDNNDLRQVVENKDIAVNVRDSVRERTSCSQSETTTTKQHWIYGCITLLLFMIIILLLAIILRKHISERLKTRKCIPKDKANSGVTVQYKRKEEEP